MQSTDMQDYYSLSHQNADMSAIHSLEAEQSVLGSLLIDDQLFDEVDINVFDFSQTWNRLIYETMTEMSRNEIPFDVVTLSEFMGEENLNLVGGLSYLGSIAKNTPTTANVHAYAKIVKNKSALRRLARLGTNLVQQAHSNEKAETIIDNAQFEVLSLDDDNQSDVLTISEILPGVVDGIDERFQNGGETVGLSTGFCDLDEMTLGFCESDLIIVAGRPSMGKTAFTTNIARHVAIEGKSSLVFSMEMPADQIVNREIAAIGRLNLSKIRKGDLEDEDWPRLTTAVGKLNNIKLLIDDSPSLTVGQVRSRARRAVKKHGVDLIVIDYLQLMKGDGENQTHSIELISKGLKSLAKELKVPVVALSQLNRELEKRSNKRPMMSDLRQSGSIEQDADLILFIYRDEVYNENSTDKGTAEIIIAKQRNGELGTARLIFRGKYCRFDNFGALDGDV